MTKLNKSTNYFEYRLTLATCLTLLRIILIPFIVCALFNNYWVAACLLFGISAITDVLDGFIARRYNQQTVLGALLDPLADKLLMISLFITLSYIASSSFMIPRWFVALIIVKELILIFVSVVLFFTVCRFTIKPILLGKLAMVAQVLCMGWIFVSHFFALTFYTVNYIILYTVAIVIVSAFVDYARRVYVSLKKPAS